MPYLGSEFEQLEEATCKIAFKVVHDARTHGSEFRVQEQQLADQMTDGSELRAWLICHGGDQSVCHAESSAAEQCKSHGV